MTPAERDIQRVILARAAEIPGVYLYRVNVSVAQAGRRAIRSAPTGHADLVGCVRGQYVAIEVKSVTGRQSPEQRPFAERVTSAGGRYLLVRSVDDAIAYLWSLSTRLAPSAP